MKIIFKCFLFTALFFSHFIALGSDTLKLKDAVLKKRISLVVSGNGGLSGKTVNLSFVNNISSTLFIKIPAGQILVSVDDEAQNLVILQEIIVKLLPKAESETDLVGACTQLSNHAPKKGELYKLGSLANGPLMEVAQIIASNDFYNVSAQAAVWGITDRGSVRNIHGSNDIDVTWDLVKIVAFHQRETLPDKVEFLSQPTQERVLVSSRSDLLYHAPRDMTGSLMLYNQAGEVIREYFQNRKLHRGLHVYTVGVNDIFDEFTTFNAKLISSEGDVLAEMNLDPALTYQDVNKETLSVNFEYIVRKPSVVSLIVYDSEDNLVEEIFLSKKVPMSKRTAKFKFFHAREDLEFFSVKVIDDEGLVLHDEKILANN